MSNVSSDLSLRVGVGAVGLISIIHTQKIVTPGESGRAEIGRDSKTEKIRT